MRNIIPPIEGGDDRDQWKGRLALTDGLQSVMSIRYAISHASPPVDIEAERTGLLQCLQKADASLLDVACRLKDAGLHWDVIRRWCRQKGISAHKWAKDKRNSPIGKRWLDKHAEFADRFDEFLKVWEWSQTEPTTPARKPGLNMFFDLMDTKRRHDTYTRAHGKTKTRTPLPVANVEHGVPIPLTPTTTLIVGDMEEMCPQHVPDGSADLVIEDVPYFLRVGDHRVVDYYLELNGMLPRFKEDWDTFASIEDYELHAGRWLDETMRMLDREGSAFVLGTFHNLGLINRLCQIRGISIINDITWTIRNSRPTVSQTHLHHTHQNILWIAKDIAYCRFNYQLCKRSHYPDDHFSSRNVCMHHAITSGRL